MNTFLPYPDFEKTAFVLDYRRLGKQRVETLQMLRGSWPHHPANKMWAGHRYQMAMYGIVICKNWISRGYKDTCLEKIMAEIEIQKMTDTGLPKWFGNEDFHLAHQSNLVRKNEDFYGKIFPGVQPNLPYIWPV